MRFPLTASCAAGRSPGRFPRRLAALCWLALLCAAASPAQEEDSWLEVVRSTPYWESQGVADNLAAIRRWVLLGGGYCADAGRHILFDRRGRFLGYIDNGAGAQETNARLNRTRRSMAAEGRVDAWAPGDAGSSGYPFALACHQPYVDIPEATARLTGTIDEYRLWGTWDGMRVGEPERQVSLIELFRSVYDHRRAQGRFTFPRGVMPTFLGKTIIESGGRKDALSAQDARGIMQLTSQVLDDCRIPDAYRLHRMAQVDCALRLMEQNHRNLEGPFQARFGGLPPPKRERLYGLLLTQSYQIGVGRAIELLQDEELGRAAAYFAANHEAFSAEDILVGLIYHNMGRRDIGLRTLYYVTDTRLAQEALCASPGMRGEPWCGR